MIPDGNAMRAVRRRPKTPKVAAPTPPKKHPLAPALLAFVEDVKAEGLSTFKLMEAVTCLTEAGYQHPADNEKDNVILAVIATFDAMGLRRVGKNPCWVDVPHVLPGLDGEMVVVKASYAKPPAQTPAPTPLDLEEGLAEILNDIETENFPHKTID